MSVRPMLFIGPLTVLRRDFIAGSPDLLEATLCELAEQGLDLRSFELIEAMKTFRRRAIINRVLPAGVDLDQRIAELDKETFVGLRGDLPVSRILFRHGYP